MSRNVFVLLLVFLGTSPLYAGKVYQTAVKLDVPKKGKDKRVPRPLDEVSFSLWLPEDIEHVRGAVLNPFYEATVKQGHWQAAVTHWDFALVGTSFFGVSIEQHAKVLKEGLVQLAKAAGRPEIADIPLCFVGMSAGGGLSVRLAEAMPERTIAVAPVCLEVGPRDDPSRSIPMITIFGERDGKQMEKLLAKLPVERKLHAQWAIAVQWRKRHEFARANNLAMPWFDRAIRTRLPEKSAKGEPVRLRAYTPSEGWLGDPESWKAPMPTIARLADYKGDPSQACWFGDAYLASVWQAFVAHESPLRIASPAGMGDGKEFQTYPSGHKLDVKVSTEGNAKFDKLELFDGNQKLGEVSDGIVSLRGDRLTPGIHALLVIGTTAEGERVVSPPNTIVVTK